MADVELRNITKFFTSNAAVKHRFGKKSTESAPCIETAVNDINIKIADGEFIVLVGPSGCGKTTTLRMIAGLEDPSAGDIFIGGKRVNDLEPKDRDVAMVFQNYALYPHMSVYDNIAFALKKHCNTGEEIERKVRWATDLLDITPYLDRKPAELSGGQRQRIAIGRCIVREPKVMLLDEPLSNQDAKLRNQMRSELIRLHRKIGATFIYVTHDQTEAMTLGDRIVVMKQGSIQQIGTPTEVFHKPANQFTAGFIGVPQMNFFPAEISQNTLRLCGKTFQLPERFSTLTDGAVTLGVRPDKLILSSDGIRGRVRFSEMIGLNLFLHLDVDGLEIAMLADESSSNMRHNDEIFFTFIPDSVYLFDSINERALI